MRLCGGGVGHGEGVGVLSSGLSAAHSDFSANRGELGTKGRGRLWRRQHRLHKKEQGLEPCGKSGVCESRESEGEKKSAFRTTLAVREKTLPSFQP